MVYFGGVEAGGTTFVCSISEDSPSNIIETESFDTTIPEETLGKIKEWFVEKGLKIVSLGIACFGPIDLSPSSPTFGFITTACPKVEWRVSHPFIHSFIHSFLIIFL